MNKILEKLRESILEYDEDGIKELAEKAIEEGIDPITAIDALADAIAEVGEKFSKGDLYLPELMVAANTMNNAMPVFQEDILKKGLKKESAGKIVIGTVFGDIHTIGINMVATLLVSGGFEVINLGCNIDAKTFLEAISKHNPDILAMSALLTTTAPQQKKVIASLKEKGIRDKVKVIIGGGAITKEFADDIGADGYEPTAPLAVKLARELLNS